MLLTGFVYLFWRQRKYKNQYEKENLEQRLLRSQMNPHFVSNALNTLCNLVTKDSKETIPYINKLSTLFRLTLENSREEFISLEEELFALKNYVELQSKLNDDFDFNIELDETLLVEDIIIPPMLIQPIVENAILHGLSRSKERGNLIIKIGRDINNSLLKCEVIDNGVGYSDKIRLNNNNTKHKSISSDIVKERLTNLKKKFKVNARLNINSSFGSGTAVELYLPYLLD